jgi:hypothetical protein
MTKRPTYAQAEAARQRWKEMVINYRKMREVVWSIMLCPEATAEHVMPAKEGMARTHKMMCETQRELEHLHVLNYSSPRMD